MYICIHVYIYIYICICICICICPTNYDCNLQIRHSSAGAIVQELSREALLLAEQGVPQAGMGGADPAYGPMRIRQIVGLKWIIATFDGTEIHGLVQFVFVK